MPDISRVLNYLNKGSECALYGAMIIILIALFVICLSESIRKIAPH